LATWAKIPENEVLHSLSINNLAWGRFSGSEEVVGSIPSGSTNFFFNCINRIRRKISISVARTTPFEMKSSALADNNHSAGDEAVCSRAFSGFHLRILLTSSPRLRIDGRSTK